MVSPHSFVLADLFGVESMSLEIPDHVLESEPGLELVPCSECDGVGSFACYGLSPYGDSARAWHRPDLDLVYKPCLRCNQQGEVLEVSPALSRHVVLIQPGYLLLQQKAA